MFTKSTKALAISALVAFSTFGGTNLIANGEKKDVKPKFKFTFQLIPKELPIKVAMGLGILGYAAYCALDYPYLLERDIKNRAKPTLIEKALSKMFLKSTKRAFFSGLVIAFVANVLCFNIGYNYFRYLNYKDATSIRLKYDGYISELIKYQNKKQKNAPNAANK